MAEEHVESDSQLIHAAYAEKVKDAFKVFAENLTMGQNEKNVRERFLRSLEMVRRARDLALQTLSDPAIAGTAAEPAPAAPRREEDLSEEAKAIIRGVVDSTTGQRQAPSPPLRR